MSTPNAPWSMNLHAPFVEVAWTESGWQAQAVGPRPFRPAQRWIGTETEPSEVANRLVDAGVSRSVRFRNLTEGSWALWAVEPSELSVPPERASLPSGAQACLGSLDRAVEAWVPSPRLFVTDMDSTLIREEVIDELARCGGRYAEVAAVTERAMRGELDFEASLRARVRALEGLPESVFGQVRDRIHATDGADRTIGALATLGCRTAVVSGGFLEVVGPFAADLGIDHAFANRLAVRDGHLTGELAAPVVDGAEKAKTLQRLMDAHGVARAAVVAVGDGANDGPMLDAAGIGIAFCAKEALRARTPHRVDRRRLDHTMHFWGLSDQDVAALAG